jgi:hypothetical protein
MSHLYTEERLFGVEKCDSLAMTVYNTPVGRVGRECRDLISIGFREWVPENIADGIRYMQYLLEKKGAMASRARLVGGSLGRNFDCADSQNWRGLAGEE